jgi:hypothetical protein
MPDTLAVAAILATLRDVLGQVSAIADRLPQMSGVALQHQTAALARRMGIIVDQETERLARRYNAEWEVRHAAGAVATAAAEKAQATQLAGEAALILYFTARAGLVGVRPCTMHEWMPAPKEVAATRVCRNCPAESKVDPS